MKKQCSYCETLQRILCNPSKKCADCEKVLLTQDNTGYKCPVCGVSVTDTDWNGVPCTVKHNAIYMSVEAQKTLAEKLMLLQEKANPNGMGCQTARRICTCLNRGSLEDALRIYVFDGDKIRQYEELCAFFQSVWGTRTDVDDLRDLRASLVGLVKS